MAKVNEQSIIKVGLASYGMSGMVFHAPFLVRTPGFQLTHVLERSSQKSRQHFPDAEIVRSFEALLENPSIELVIVNTPNALHFEMTRQALLAGKHVVVEKPFTVTYQEANSLIQLAKEKQLVLTVFQNRRWDGDFMTVQKIVEQQLLGRLVEYEAHYDRYVTEIRSESWKETDLPGSGILYNLGSHMIDQALVLFGKPRAVTADIGARRKGSDVDDYYNIILHYPDLKVNLKSSYLVRELGPRYMLHGTTGSFVKYGIDPQEEALKVGKFPEGDDWGKEPDTDWGKLNAEINGFNYVGKIETLPGNYSAFYQNLYDAIRYGKPLAVKPEEAADVIHLIELIIKSNKEGRTVEVEEK